MHATSDRTVLVVFGTRPEIVKLMPLVRALEATSGVRPVTCLFRQHRLIADQTLAAFGYTPTYAVPISLSDQALFAPGVGLLRKLATLMGSGIGFFRFLMILRRERPAVIVVQGDTSTAFLAAFLSFHLKVPIAHVEAGLRTYDKYRPFPEEANRRLIGAIADLHFAPTAGARENLLSEHVPADRIWVVGNTDIDAVRLVAERVRHPDVAASWERWFSDRHGIVLKGKRLVLVTAHRRESFGEGLERICEALRDLAASPRNIQIVYPVHPNPNVRGAVHAALKGVPGIALISPLAYEPFTFLMDRAELILTDSGGIQEEASFLGKPVLVMRTETERPEVVAAGAAALIGTDRARIVDAANRLLDDTAAREAMGRPRTLFGDGHAAEAIAKILTETKNAKQ